MHILPSQMRTAALAHYGDINAIEITHLPLPSISKDMILIKNSASSINPLDWKLCKGSFRLVMPLRFPAILGFDFCGEIVAVGEKVTQFQVGDWVFGMSNQQGGRCFAEYVAIDPACTVKLPNNISHTEAAAIPLAGLTALQALTQLTQLKPKQKVLINGASGGVGFFAVQLALALEAEVSIVCSKANHPLFEGLALQKLIDYKTQSIFTEFEAKSFDVIFDVAATLKPTQALTLLKKEGCYISTLPSLNLIFAKIYSLFSQKKVKLIMTKSRQEDLQQLALYIQNQKIRPLIYQVFPLEEIRQAMELSKSGKTFGKVVIQIY